MNRRLNLIAEMTVAVLPFLVGLLVFLILIVLCGCGSQVKDPAPKSTDRDKELPKMNVTTEAFEPGGPIPQKYTGEGEDVSPALSWSGTPEGTKQIALICDDPDAPTKDPWVHWVIFAIPADAKGLPEGVPRDAELTSPAGAKQGLNSWPKDNIGYRGPMPPPGDGVHHYHFKVYALDAPVDLAPGKATKEALLKAMEGHILAQAEVVGTYERKK